jgi:DNA-directed RNA polymerase specialized sigma24 family protein
MEPIVTSYFQNNAKKLNNMVDKILYKLHFVDIDKNDFYSLANEVFMYTVRDYEPSKSFDGFLYSCLYKKFCSEMTRRRREKRKADRMSISIDTPVGEEKNLTLGDTIADDFDVEKEVLEDDEEEYSSKMLLYLSKLSNLQKEVLKLNIAGYLPNEIREELHINEKEYADCYAAIHSYRNVSVLF